MKYLVNGLRPAAGVSKNADASQQPSYVPGDDYRALMRGFSFFNVKIRRKALGFGYYQYFIKERGQSERRTDLMRANLLLASLFDKFAGRV
jgi:hypothetical protein